MRYKAGESIRAGTTDSLNFKLYEGPIEHPVSENRYVGLFKVAGNDFSDGVIPAGTDIICDYEILDSGTISLEVSVPLIGGSFKPRGNFYSRKEGEFDFTKAAKLVRKDAERVQEQLEDIASRVDDPALAEVREKLERALSIAPTETNPETAKQAMDDVQKAKESLAKARKANQAVIRTMDLDSAVAFFNGHVRQFAKPAEATSFDALVKTAERAIQSASSEFDSYLRDIRGRNFSILWRQDWFVADRFNWYVEDANLFADANVHAALVAEGRKAMERNDVEALRAVVEHMDENRISSPDADDFLAKSNLVRG